MHPNCHSVLHSIPDAVISLDKDGYILYVNPATTSLFNLYEKEIVGQPFHLLYQNDGIKSEYELEQARKKREFSGYGWRQKREGGQFWAEYRICAVYDQRELTGYTCLLTDASGKKKAELEMLKREERFRLMVDAVKDYAIFLLDVNGHICTWNEGAQRIKGYTADEITGKHFSIFYTAEDLQSKKPERELNIALATGKYEEEGWRIKKNGSLFWANIVITALFNDENKLVGFSKVTRDLTERRKYDESMRQSEERYRSLVEQVTDYGIFMMDDKGRIVSWNEGASRINGYKADEIIGKYFSIFYPEEDIISNKPRHELEVAKTHGKYEEEGWRLRKDGSRFWASVVITAIYNTEGIHIGYSKVTRDLTERKESEKALRDAYDRYRMLAGELKTANDELSEANSELEQFTSIVSHDLQEPIRTIKSFLQLIEIKLNEGELDNLKIYINKSIAAANRMRELIQNLLHYSQIGKMEVSEKVVKVNDLINEAIQNLKMAVDNSKAEITIHSEVETVCGDPVQLVQLIQNLVSNALKFTTNEYPKIVIRCWMEKDHVKFAVTDNGIGIAPGDLGKVFEIFRRLHTKKEYAGTGIGLAICKKIVDRHGGEIWPESEPGKGTTFYFTLNNQKVPLT
jgi:PAS domain S-box-containing protein